MVVFEHVSSHVARQTQNLGHFQEFVMVLINLNVPLQDYGGPSLSHVFLASKQRLTSFSTEMINSIFHFILSLVLLTISILNCLLKVRLISKGF